MKTKHYLWIAVAFLLIAGIYRFGTSGGTYSPPVARAAPSAQEIRNANTPLRNFQLDEQAKRDQADADKPASTVLTTSPFKGYEFAGYSVPNPSAHLLAENDPWLKELMKNNLTRAWVKQTDWKTAEPIMVTPGAQFIACTSLPIIWVATVNNPKFKKIQKIEMTQERNGSCRAVTFRKDGTKGKEVSLTSEQKIALIHYMESIQFRPVPEQENLGNLKVEVGFIPNTTASPTPVTGLEFPDLPVDETAVEAKAPSVEKDDKKGAKCPLLPQLPQQEENEII